MDDFYMIIKIQYNIFKWKPFTFTLNTNIILTIEYFTYIKHMFKKMSIDIKKTIIANIC